jgi:hypothetical protein
MKRISILPSILIIWVIIAGPIVTTHAQKTIRERSIPFTLSSGSDCDTLLVYNEKLVPIDMRTYKGASLYLLPDKPYTITAKTTGDTSQRPNTSRITIACCRTEELYFDVMVFIPVKICMYVAINSNDSHQTDRTLPPDKTTSKPVKRKPTCINGFLGIPHGRASCFKGCPGGSCSAGVWYQGQVYVSTISHPSGHPDATLPAGTCGCCPGEDCSGN